MTDTATVDVLQQLAAQADEQLEATEPEEWGEALELAEGEKFLGRYLGDAISPVTGRGVFLLYADEMCCFIRERTKLRSEFDRVRPVAGDYVVIARGVDQQGKENTYHNYVVVNAPCADPLPEGAVTTGGGESSDEVPFEPAA